MLSKLISNTLLVSTWILGWCTIFPVTVVKADVGLLSFWVPELYALLDLIESEKNPVETHIFGGRKFYVTQFRGHNVIAVNTGVGISNAAAATATLLQKFPTIDRIVGSGIAGGVDPELRVGDVVVPERWALYQDQHFAKVDENGDHILPQWVLSSLWGTDCGFSADDITEDGPIPCTPGVNTWNYDFIYPQSVAGADPDAEGDDATSEGSHSYGWFNVDPQMLAVAQSIAPNVTLANSLGDASLDYEPMVVVGGNGVAGPTYVDNAAYREYVFQTFQAKALDMETPAAAHVATQFGKKFLFFRSLSDLAGGEDESNSLGIFFGIAAANAVTALSAFLEELPVENNSEGAPVPADHFPGEATPGLLGILSFWEPELDALKAIMNDGEGASETLVFGGRKFYRGTIAGADVVATLTGVSISNAAMTTTLMAMLYPGVERIIGGGIAGGVDPSLKVGDVVIPERWAMYQMQVYGRNREDYWVPVEFESDLVVGKDCGGWNGIDEFLTGNETCDFSLQEASNFGMIFPKTIQTPDPNGADEMHLISEGETRKWWFEVDSEMYEMAKEAVEGVVLKNESPSGVTLPHNPEIYFGGNGISGPTFVDNAEYRTYVFEHFQARCLDMESAAAAHIAYQNGIPVLFLRSLSDLAGGDEDSNVIDVFFSLAAENAFTVTKAVIEKMYPVKDAAEDDAAGDGSVNADEDSSASTLWTILYVISSSILVLALC